MPEFIEREKTMHAMQSFLVNELMTGAETAEEAKGYNASSFYKGFESAINKAVGIISLVSSDTGDTVVIAVEKEYAHELITALKRVILHDEDHEFLCTDDFNLRFWRKNYPDLWALLLKWDKDSPVTFKTDGHTVHDFDRRFQAEDDGIILPNDRKFRWSQIDGEVQIKFF